MLENTEHVMNLTIDARRLVMAFGTLLSNHSLQLYNSALTFTPHGTNLYKQYAQGITPICVTLNAKAGWSPSLSPSSGHSSAVRSIVFSSDGSRLASCSADKTLRLWNTHTGGAIGGAMVGHTASVESIVFSPDGRRLASCSKDRTVRLWDAATGEPIGRAMVGHTGLVTSIVFSPDGRRLASGSSDKTVRLWDSATGDPLGEPMAGHTNSITSVAFSPDSCRLASSSSDKTVRLWGVTGRTIGGAMTGHTGSVTSIVFSLDGRRLASCSQDNTVRLWDGVTGEPIGGPMLGHSDTPSMVTFSSDGNLVTSHSSTKSLVWDTCTGQISNVDSDNHGAFPGSCDMTVAAVEDGWLFLNRQRMLWIPDEYRGKAVKAIMESVSGTVCIGGNRGSVLFIKVPTQYIAPLHQGTYRAVGER
jgi:WD40 repeat protein